MVEQFFSYGSMGSRGRSDPTDLSLKQQWDLVLVWTFIDQEKFYSGIGKFDTSIKTWLKTIPEIFLAFEKIF